MKMGRWLLGIQGSSLLNQTLYVGDWEEKYWKNIPGPIYSTTANMRSLMASNLAKSCLMHDFECEFVWRQPQSERELEECLYAINLDETASYQVDGNDRWTVEGVRAWWRVRSERNEWDVSRLNGMESNAERYWNGGRNCYDPKLVADYMIYMEQASIEYLRSYMFFLENGYLAGPGDALPRL